jgi:uncharacterized protein YbaR (Trm112 family)
VFIELVDMLRCPNRHEDTWLVLSAHRTVERDIMEGVLGCPICHAEYPIEAGVVRFDGGTRRPSPTKPPDEDEAIRLAALLDLTDSQGYAILVGDTASHASRLRELTDVQLLLVNPPAGIEMGSGLSGLTTSGTAPLPLGEASARAIALDNTATPALLESALHVVRSGARLVVPIDVAIPTGVTQLARDERHWVAERTPTATTSGIISIDRRR